MKYLENKIIKTILDNASNYRKLEKTLLRLPKENEVGIQLITYVKSDNTIRKKSSSTITNDSIIARNQKSIGLIDNQEIYNEWPISLATVKKNYGEDIIDELTVNFQPFQKIATVKAVKLTRKLLDVLNVKEDHLEITVDWSNEPMIAEIGDYLTDQNYSISANDMNAYEKVENN
jgi:hypothetical protein